MMFVQHSLLWKYAYHLTSHKKIPHLKKPCIVNSEGADGGSCQIDWTKLFGHGWEMFNFQISDQSDPIFKIVSIRDLLHKHFTSHTAPEMSVSDLEPYYCKFVLILCVWF